MAKLKKTPTAKVAEAKASVTELRSNRDYKDAKTKYTSDVNEPDALVTFATALVLLFAKKQWSPTLVDAVAKDEQTIRENAYHAKFGRMPKKRRQNKSDLLRVLQFATMAGSIAAWKVIADHAVNWSYCKGTVARVLRITGTGDKAKALPKRDKLIALCNAERASRNKGTRTRTGAPKRQSEGEVLASLQNLASQFSRRFKASAAHDYVVAALASIDEAFDAFARAQVKATLKGKLAEADARTPKAKAKAKTKAKRK